MEALVVTLCKAMTVSEVAQLLQVGPMRIWRILDRYVEAARAQEDFRKVQAVGLDETAARRGHRYISLFHDLEERRLLFACEGRKAEVVDAFCEDLEAHGGCAENISDICIDMSASFASGIATHLPWAEVTFNEFHVIQLVNKAVDQVRREEARQVPLLKRSRYVWHQGCPAMDPTPSPAVCGSLPSESQNPSSLAHQGVPARDLRHRLQCRRGRTPSESVVQMGLALPTRTHEASSQDPQGALARHSQCLPTPG
jgi:hypothetical protein